MCSGLLKIITGQNGFRQAKNRGIQVSNKHFGSGGLNRLKELKKTKNEEALF